MYIELSAVSRCLHGGLWRKTLQMGFKNGAQAESCQISNWHVFGSWVRIFTFSLLSFYRKCIYHEYELQPTVVPSVGAQYCKINDALVSHQTLGLGEQTFRFSASFVGGKEASCLSFNQRKKTSLLFTDVDGCTFPRANHVDLWFHAHLRTRLQILQIVTQFVWRALCL